MQILISLILNALALIATAYVVPGFRVDSLLTAILAAIVIGFVNTFLRPILQLLTFPITILTLGLFTFVLNALILWTASLVVPGFRIEGILAAILGAVVLSIVSTILTHLAKDLKLS